MKPIGFCDQCGAEVESGSKFCEQCGSPVHSFLEAAPPQPAVHPSSSAPSRPAGPAPVAIRRQTATPVWKIGAGIIISGLVAVCGLLAIVLGLGMFSAGVTSGAEPATEPAVNLSAALPATPLPTSTRAAAAPSATPAPTVGKIQPVMITVQSTPAENGERAGARDAKEFFDDFSTGLNLWEIKSDKSNGVAEISDGKLKLRVTRPNKYLSLQVPWSFSSAISDVTLSMTVTVQTPGAGAFGLFCRASDAKNFYMVSLNPNPAGGGQYRFYKDEAGEIIHLTDWVDTPLLNGGETPEKVVFSCLGDTLSLELNGKLAGKVHDGDLRSGRADLFALSLDEASEDNPYLISIDDFRAIQP